MNSIIISLCTVFVLVFTSYDYTQYEFIDRLQSDTIYVT